MPTNCLTHGLSCTSAGHCLDSLLIELEIPMLKSGLILVVSMLFSSCGNKTETKQTLLFDTYLERETDDSIIITSKECGDVILGKPINSEGKDIVITSDGDVVTTQPIDSGSGDVTIKADGDIVIGSPINAGLSLDCPS